MAALGVGGPLVVVAQDLHHALDAHRRVGRHGERVHQTTRPDEVSERGVQGSVGQLVFVRQKKTK